MLLTRVWFRSIHCWYFAYLYCHITPQITSSLFTMGNGVISIFKSNQRVNSRKSETYSENSSLRFCSSRTIFCTKISVLVSCLFGGPWLIHVGLFRSFNILMFTVNIQEGEIIQPFPNTVVHKMCLFTENNWVYTSLHGECVWVGEEECVCVCVCV